MSLFSASIELATVIRTLPSYWRQQGGIAAIQYAFQFGYAERLWSKAEAVHLLFLEQMERAQSRGGGHRVRRRIERMRFEYEAQQDTQAEHDFHEQMQGTLNED